jgi:hypothetical protein
MVSTTSGTFSVNRFWPEAAPSRPRRSLSGYITQVLEEQQRGESLQALLKDLIEQHGEPPAKDKTWAERALAPRRG